MSILVMSRVWQHAKVSGGTLVVLLAMSDYAHDDGGGVYPTQATLAAKARMSERNVRDCLKELEDAGYIERTGKRGSLIEWRVNPEPDFRPEETAVRQPTAGLPGSPLPTEPSVNPQPVAANAATKSPSTSSSSEIASDPPAASPQSEPAGDGSDTNGPPRSTYIEPSSPGAAAAPWLVLELARLMRRNDDRAKVPAPIAGMETLPRPATPDAAREQIAAVVHTPALKPWLDAARLLIDTDGRDTREVVKVLRWCQADEFWKTTVLSMPKFREKYPQLRGKALGQASPRASATAGTDARSQLDAMARRRNADNDEGKAVGDAR